MPSDFDHYPAAEIMELVTFARIRARERKKRKAQNEDDEREEIARRQLEELRARPARES